MTPDRLAHLQVLCAQLEAKTRLCEVLAQVMPPDWPRTPLMSRLRELAEDHLAFGSALRRMVDAADSEGEPCAI